MPVVRGDRAMSDDMQPINFSEFQGRAPRAAKRKTKGDPERDLSDIAQARDDAAAVADSRKLEAKSIEELAELAIRRAANVVLLGGDEFLPTSLKEASDVAKIWASVASMEASRRNGKGSTLAEDDPIAQNQLRVELQRLRLLGKKADK